MITTTLNRIRTHSPCGDSWRKLLSALGKTAADDEPLPYTRILEICGLDDALWALRAEPQHSRLWRLMACDFADSVRHLMTDPRSMAAIDIARRHADGLATNEELAAARDAERDAARDAAWAAAWDAARDAARDAALAAARDAALAAARDAAWDAARAAARDAERDAARESQREVFIGYVSRE